MLVNAVDALNPDSPTTSPVSLTASTAGPIFTPGAYQELSGPNYGAPIPPATEHNGILVSADRPIPLSSTSCWDQVRHRRPTGTSRFPPGHVGRHHRRHRVARCDQWFQLVGCQARRGDRLMASTNLTPQPCHSFPASTYARRRRSSCPRTPAHRSAWTKPSRAPSAHRFLKRRRPRAFDPPGSSASPGYASTGIGTAGFSSRPAVPKLQWIFPRSSYTR